MFEERFTFSGLSKDLGWYRCYDDLSSDDWMDGSELWEHSDVWDERAVDKWNFFYRPYPPAVGRPQKKMIQERKATINACEAYTRQAQEQIAARRESINQARKTFLVWSGLLGFVALVLIFKDFWTPALLPALGIGGAGWSFGTRRSLALSKIEQLERSIANYSESIRRNELEIGVLQNEVDQLLEQIPKPVSAWKIQEWLRDEIGMMELTCLSDFVGKEVDRETAGRLLARKFGDDRVFGLLIDSWGALQPTAQRGPFGNESTGLGKARNKLGDRMTTWQIGLHDRPAFRLLFLQYVFPLEKNLNVCSFFYDFITRKAFGKRYETFQYNHVTNYSVREVQPDEEPWVQDLGLLTMSKLLKDKELRALTIAVTSGNHFRCVLVDEDVVDVLNQHMSNQEKYQSVLAAVLDEEELKKRFNGDKRLIEDWKKDEQTRIEAERKRLVREKQTLREVARSTRVMLTHVRDCIEHYVLRVQQPA
ncbi:MAG TPA: hypothetical protein VFC23_13785 [Thermoanaerobaculia bacterium]|nr:hypothetical protein [Thermoanaerobaculia bacterium]